MIISQFQRLPAFNFKEWKNDGAAGLVNGDRDRTLAQIDPGFSRLLSLAVCSLEPYEMEIPAVRRLALRFLGQAIARFAPTYFCWLETVVKLGRAMILAKPSRTEETVWLGDKRGKPFRCRYDVLFWPDIAVVVPKAESAFGPKDGWFAVKCANEMLNEKAATRTIQQRYLLLTRAKGEEWWCDFSPTAVPLQSPIPAIQVCALLTFQVGATKEAREVARWYLQKRPALERWGAESYAKAAKSLLIEDIYHTLRDMG